MAKLNIRNHLFKLGSLLLICFIVSESLAYNYPNRAVPMPRSYAITSYRGATRNFSPYRVPPYAASSYEAPLVPRTPADYQSTTRYPTYEVTTLAYDEETSADSDEQESEEQPADSGYTTEDDD